MIYYGPFCYFLSDLFITERDDIADNWAGRSRPDKIARIYGL